MKFRVFSRGPKVIIQISDVDDDSVSIIGDFGLIFSANAVRDRIEDAMRDRVKEIRAKAYEAGWSDAKAKRTKKTQFAGCINSDPKYVGY